MPGHSDSCASPDQNTQEVAVEAGQGQSCSRRAERETQPGSGETEAAVWPWRLIVRAGPTWARVLPSAGSIIWLLGSEKGSDLGT